ncbi:MAG: hypothetical protein COB09_18470 [Thalassobium sp.]|nr:MAG: hypothetical protein COB09_18470 [Thalassobium sp.]
MPPLNEENVQIALTKAELEEIMEKTVMRAFTRCGIDSSDPIKLQQDFSYLRNLRESAKSLRTIGFTAAILTVIGGVGTALFVGLRELMNKGS